MDVAGWLRELGLPQYEAAFRDNAIDAQVLPGLTTDDLKDLGVTLVGHRRRMLDAIAALRLPRDSAETATTDRCASAVAERRQLTVMFCDLVGSTSLSDRLDPEDLRELIGAYHVCCADAITAADGFVAQYLGDGVLAYFGYPKAEEHDAERAVRAALGLVEQVPQLPARHGIALAMRIGLATGVVVIGELMGTAQTRGRSAVGDTPNLAARLQGLAQPGHVVIAHSTRRLIGGLFEYEDLGEVTLKGFVQPVRAWRVRGGSSAESRFEARHEMDLTPLVGRETQLEILQACWLSACRGEGRCVMVSGTAGIGKSRVVGALQATIGAPPYTRLRYFCSPHHANSALFPVIGQLERAAGFVRADDVDQKRAKLRALLAANSSRIEEDTALVADLLLPATPGTTVTASAKERREQLFAVFLRQLETLAEHQPVLLLYEDIHWIDPSTRQLLDMIVERVAQLRVLVIATFRSELQTPWHGPHVVSIELEPLERADGAALVAGVPGSDGLSKALIAQIVERADGIPLFVEELTKAVLESAADRRPGDKSERTVPATLHASLTARLDRLGETAKEIAQVGATIGREFSYDLLAPVSGRREPHLGAALDRCIESALLFSRGTTQDRMLVFKHALVRDAAYGSLLRARRQELHKRIVAVIESDFPDLVMAQPELLAHHCYEAGMIAEAIQYYLAASGRATAASNNVEASAHLTRGTGLLAEMSPSDPRTAVLRHKFVMGGWWWTA